MSNTGFHKLSQSESVAITYLRAISIVLILVCHICLSYHLGWENILNIGVQIFLLISGLLHGIKRIDDPIAWYIAKFRKVFIPYYIYIAVILPIYFIAWPSYISWESALCHILDIQMFKGGIKGLGQLWFMTAIAICYLITPILQLFKRYSFIMSITLFVLALLNYTFLHKSEFLFSALFMYSFGYYIINCEKYIRTTFIIFSFIITISLFFIPSVHISILLKPTAGSAGRIFHDFAAIFLTLSSIAIHIRNNAYIAPIGIKWLSDWSFPIYIVHGLFCTSSPISTFKVFPNQIIAISMFLVLTITSAYILKKSINWINSSAIKN